MSSWTTANKHHASTHGQPIPGETASLQSWRLVSYVRSRLLSPKKSLSQHTAFRWGLLLPLGILQRPTGSLVSKTQLWVVPHLKKPDVLGQHLKETTGLCCHHIHDRGVTSGTQRQPRAHPTPSLDRSWLVGELKAEAVQVGTGSDIQEVPGEVNVPPAFCLGHTHTPPPPPQLAAADSKSS